MANLPFTDKYGHLLYCETQLAFVREKGYVIIRKGDLILCHRDDDIVSLPLQSDVELNAAPTAEFSVISYLAENGCAVTEMQNYRVYVVENASLEGKDWQWCALNDILLNKVAFNATQLIGIKNLMVRVKEK
jgi:hypothetical protein